MASPTLLLSSAEVPDGKDPVRSTAQTYCMDAAPQLASVDLFIRGLGVDRYGRLAVWHAAQINCNRVRILKEEEQVRLVGVDQTIPLSVADTGIVRGEV